MEKDYSKYFSGPNLKEAKKRGKKEVEHIDYSVKGNIKDLGKNKKYLVRTFGCQGNLADSEVISGILESLGFVKTEDETESDIILLNTCAIRENAEDRVFGEIGRLMRYKRSNPDLLIGVCGCMPQEENVVERIMKKHKQVDLVFGTHNIHKLPEYLETAYLSKERVVEVWSTEGDLVENLPIQRDNKHKAWVNIMFGCDEFCTYCIVPYTRGTERSRKPENILNEVRELVASGCKEVTLLGQNVNAYGKDFTDGYTFGKLLKDLNKIDIPRIRYTTSHPRDIDDETIEAMGLKGNIMPHLHLPVQSGNNEVLKKMNRKYTIESYKEKIAKLREVVPSLALTTDIIVGFPNETEEQFEETIQLVKDIKFEGGFTFIYSKREGTPAAKFPDTVSDEDKKTRLLRLNKYINVGFQAGNDRFDGKIVTVLVDGLSRKNKEVLAGYSEHNKLVNFRGDASLIGKLVKVKVTEAKTWNLMGELVE